MKESGIDATAFRLSGLDPESILSGGLPRFPLARSDLAAEG